ncbi:MAG: 5'-nucleotidase C-terminal domain-containing protein [Flavobacterium sp.]|nr:5'-nucleotidase C-terminal domain-containing protein [Flavobacterium sp.]
MVNLKKYNVLLQQFVLFLTFAAFLSCGQQKIVVTKIEGKQININNSAELTPSVETFIKPYRENIEKDLSEILAFAPQNIDKTGEWQSSIGNLLADVVLKKGNPILKSRKNVSIDFCLLNHGGIRAIIPKGNVTARTAFEIMPFENSLIIVAMKGSDILEIPTYIIKEKKPHPLSGMTFTIDKNNLAQNILIQGKPLNENKTYYVATSDYLANGGDNMTFFKKNSDKIDLDYKLRNILIDYFKSVDTIPLVLDKRIIVE